MPLSEGLPVVDPDPDFEGVFVPFSLFVIESSGVSVPPLFGRVLAF